MLILFDELIMGNDSAREWRGIYRTANTAERAGKGAFLVVLFREYS